MSRERVREGVLGGRGLTVIAGGKSAGGDGASDGPSDGGLPPGGGGGSGATHGADRDNPPITVLGHDEDGSFHFLDRSGFKRHLSGRDMVSRGGLSALFLGDLEWLREHFPKKVKVKRADEQGGERDVEITVDYMASRAGEWLMALCRHAGGYDASLPVRRPGVWRASTDTPVVHLGDYVLLDGTWRMAGFRDRAGAVWPSTSARHRSPTGRDPDGIPVPPLRATPASTAIGIRLQTELRDLWRWRGVGGEIVLIGWLCTAYYGAATAWRPAAFISGEPGSGKSMLVQLLRAALPMHVYSTDASKAGIEGALNGTAMPALIDESADRGDGRGAHQLLDVVLSAASGTGTAGLRGRVEGGSRRVDVVASVAMAAVNVPELQPQHRARFVLFELMRPDGGADHRSAMEAATAHAARDAGALWWRALAGWPRYQVAMRVYREALARSGCAPREQDQFASLLSGWWVLTADGEPTERDGDSGVLALVEYVRRADDVEEDSGPRRCVDFLASSLIQIERSTEQATIGELLVSSWASDIVDADIGARARRVLERYGIRSIRENEPADRMNGKPAPRGTFGDGLWISRSARPLHDVFDRHRAFRDGRWGQELLRLNGAVSPNRPIRIAGQVVKAIWLPRSAWDRMPHEGPVLSPGDPDPDG